MPLQLPFVMAHLRLGNRADSLVLAALGGGVVGREHSGGGTDHGADVVVHGPALVLVDQPVGERGAGGRVAGGAVLGDGHLRVSVQVRVVVGRGADDGAGLSRLREVDVRVRGRERRVGRADDRAVGLGGGHCVLL